MVGRPFLTKPRLLCHITNDIMVWLMKTTLNILLKEYLSSVEVCNFLSTLLATRLKWPSYNTYAGSSGFIHYS